MTALNPGKIKIYTSGWPKNQNSLRAGIELDLLLLPDQRMMYLPTCLTATVTLLTIAVTIQYRKWYRLTTPRSAIPRVRHSHGRALGRVRVRVKVRVRVRVRG